MTNEFRVIIIISKHNLFEKIHKFTIKTVVPFHFNKNILKFLDIIYLSLYQKKKIISHSSSYQAVINCYSLKLILI